MRSQRILAMGLLAAMALACDSVTTPDAAVSIAQPTARGYVMARWYEEIPSVDPGECPQGLNLTEAD